MRLFLFIVGPSVLLGAIALWLFADRAPPFYVRTTGLDIPVMEFSDQSGITMGIVLNTSGSPQLIRNLDRGGYLLTFAMPGEKYHEQAFHIGLGYIGSHRRRLDLDISPAAIKDGWHIRLMADGTTTLFERDVAHEDASDERPCLIRF